MKHAAVTDEVVERTGLYALGALTLTEARAFEDHLAEGCEVCRNELDAYQFTVGALATATPDEEPTARVRRRLLASLGDAPSAATQAAIASAPPLPDSEAFVSLRASSEGWEEWGKGVFFKPLFVDEPSGQMTSLVRMAPGTALPPHQHLGVEQFLIIEGDCLVQGEQLGPGDYHRAMGGTIHETTSTEHGTMFLLVAPKEYRILELR